jgi:hypothetical protein
MSYCLRLDGSDWGLNSRPVSCISSNSSHTNTPFIPTLHSCFWLSVIKYTHAHIYPSAFGQWIGIIRRPSKFLREIAAQMLVGFGTESTKGPCQDTPSLPPTTSLQEDPSPQLYSGRYEDWSTTGEEKTQLSSGNPSPDYSVGDQLEDPQPTGGPEHP